MTLKPSYTELENKIKELEHIISEDKGAKRKLLESNRTLEEIQRVAKIGSWLYDPATDALTWSEEMFHIFGINHSSQPPSNEETRKIIHPDDWFYFDTAVKRAIADGVVYDLELRIITPGGEIRHIRTRGYAEKVSSGAVKRLIGTTQDITESKKAQAALLESQERYRALFDNIPINTVVVDKEGKITDCRFPDHPEEILQPNIGDVMYKDFAQYPHIDMYKELMESISSGTQKEYLDLSYDEKFLHIRISPYHDGAIITAIDTTPIRKLESELQLTRKRESIGTLAGGIAHEFNNMLGVIIGNAELAMETMPDNNVASDFLKEVLGASHRAKNVVRQILSFARKTPVDRAPTKISTVVQDSFKLIKSTIEKSIMIREKILCDSEIILGNPTEISQILLNLCKNSEQAMRGGVGEITLGLEPVIVDDKMASRYESISAGKYVRLTVSDTGEGVDPKIIDRILDPYFTTKDVDEGLGMGLAVVYGIVKKYDGAIKIKSDLGEGTTVEILLPIAEINIEEGATLSETLSTGTEHILFVDDEPSLVKLATHILEQQGYKVTGVINSSDALAIFRREPDKFDLIVTDLAMPVMPGDMLIREVFKIRPEIPIILSSGHSDRIDEKMVEELSVMAYAMKPLDRGELIKTVRAVLDKANKKSLPAID